MRRTLALVLALVMLPASAALATDLDQILEESKDASTAPSR
jgi:hypothetical protein